MLSFRPVVLALLLFPSLASAANLSYSTYLKDGLTPTAMAADAQGNLYIAGKLVTDAVSGATTAIVAKLDAKASQFLYVAYLDGAASDDVRGIAVDSAGNAYVTGASNNPNFPVTSTKLATPPTGRLDARAFVTKLGPNGNVIFSVLVGGSAVSTAQAIALAPQGQILISGVVYSTGFPVTPGAYAVADSKGHPFLMELDAAAGSMVFSATGIGGNSLAFDGAGNIFVAGSTTLLDYPTTPGAYQTTFTPSFYCFGLCQIGFPGGQQYLSKVNASGSQLIYSTGINGGTAFRSGSIRNAGLAVDAAGNAYVTGVADASAYLFPTAVAEKSPFEYGFLTKIDAAGSTALYSVPVGGGGVQLDATGSVYVGGFLTAYNTGLDLPAGTFAPPAPFAWVPQQCLPNRVTGNSSAYLVKLDAATGNVTDSQWLDGSGVGAVSVTIAGGKVWMTGATQLADVPLTAGALAPANLSTGALPGAYLAAVDFSVTATGPRIGCVLDGGNFMHTGPVAPKQLITLFGTGLGPAVGVAAGDTPVTSLSGVTVTFDGVPAQLLYVSASQINVVAPDGIVGKAGIVMQASVNGVVTVARQFPVVRANPNLLADLSQSQTNCAGPYQNNYGFAPMVTNADGSLNTCTNPAKLGSQVSFYVHGVGLPVCFCFDAMVGYFSAAVVNASVLSAILTRVDVQLPGSFTTGSISTVPAATVGVFAVTLGLFGEAIGPVTLPVPMGLVIEPVALPAVSGNPGSPGLAQQAMPMLVWATR